MLGRAPNHDRKKPKGDNLDRAAYSSESVFQEVARRRGRPLGLCVTIIDTDKP